MSTLASKINLQSLVTAVNQLTLPAFKSRTFLSLFPSVPIEGGIAAEKWATKYLLETKKASMHARGYTPNQITMDFAGFDVEPGTCDQEARLNEIDQAQFERAGLISKIAPELGYNMAYTSNTWVMLHKDGNGGSGFNKDYHYILATGNSTGTVARPNPFYDSATSGAWSTVDNIYNDLTRLKTSFTSNGINPNECLLLVPQIASYNWERRRTTTDSKTTAAMEADAMGINWIYVDDAFLTTYDLSTAPTAASFDLVMIRPADFLVGWEREERVRVIPPHDEVRDMLWQGEGWFGFVCLPTRRNLSGTIYTYKSMARIRTIQQS